MSNDRSPLPSTRAVLVAVALAAGGLVGAATGSAQATPFVPAPTGTLAAGNDVVAVRYGWHRHHGWGHRHHGWHRGPHWGWRHHHRWGHRHGWRHHHHW